MKKSLVVSLLLLSLTIALPEARAVVTAACDVKGPGATFDRIQHTLKLRTKAAEIPDDSIVELSVQRSPTAEFPNGRTEIYRSQGIHVGEDGTVYVRLDRGVVPLKGERVIDFAVAPAGASQLGLVKTIAPRAAAMPPDALAAAAREYQGQLVTVTMADRSTRQGYLRPFSTDAYALSAERSPKFFSPHDNILAHDISVVESSESYFRNQARNYYVSQETIAITVNGKPALGKILGMDQKSMLLQVVNSDGHEIPNASQIVSFTDVSEMKAAKFQPKPAQPAQMAQTMQSAQTRPPAAPRAAPEPVRPKGTNDVVRGESHAAGGAKLEGNIVSGEIGGSKKPVLEKVFSPVDGKPISTVGDSSYVNFGTPSHPRLGKVTGITSDGQGHFTIEVSEVTAPNVRAKPRPLTAEEIAHLRTDAAAKQAY